MTELIERVARAVCKAFAMDYHGLCEIDANFEADKEWENWIPEAKAAIAAMQADAAPVAWIKPDWENNFDGTSPVTTHRIAGWTPLYAMPVADRVSTSSPVDDRGSGNTSDKLRDAMAVWEEAYRAWEDALINPDRIGDEDRAAAAIIEQDREAVRAEQAAELAKWKALAETLAGALDSVAWSDYYGIEDDMMSNGCEHGFKPASSCPNKGCDKGKLERTINEALRKYKETRDAS